MPKTPGGSTGPDEPTDPPGAEASQEMMLRKQVEAAYRRARREVIGGGPTPDAARLTPHEAEIMDELERAERELREWREARDRRER
ncbi:MAG: hypothetical protein QOJ92_551 [Frankiales bacterium]|nr:hypothetical protein [Frankiales bacterium]